jgi:hypothetical protein
VADRVTFTKQSAERIARVVRTVEAGNRDASGVVTAPRFSGAATGKIFRICTFTGAWSINTSKTVTFKYQTETPNTVSALNLFANVPAPPSTANCAIGREGTAWFLIAAECITAT